MAGKMTGKIVTIEVTHDGAQCECGHVTSAGPRGQYHVTPHMREAHGMTDPFDFEKVSEVICPRRITLRVHGALQRGSSASAS